MNSREEFLAHLHSLVEEIVARPPENSSTGSYIEAAEAWLGDADGFYKNIGESRDVDVPDWQLFADILSAALEYE